MTMVFSDLSGSTVLGERLDPESLRRVMSRYFDEMRSVLERHGGAVEKFVGDAILAVFGIPELHEDDALRAVRAAAEMRAAQATLNEELANKWGVRLGVRTGVNTGEVIAGDPAQGQSFATGDAVNVAARLEQAASVGEVLIGRETLRLVRDAVIVEEVGPLELKGKSEPVAAWRLVGVVERAAGVSRRLDSPLVGRERELTVLQEAFAGARESASCELVTVIGSAGAGKSRLAAELRRRVEVEAAVLEGRCLSYGDGITFWPVAEMVKLAADIREDDEPSAAREKIAGLLAADDRGLVAERVASALGAAAPAGSLQEFFWAVRRLFEELARDRALVLLFEDIHWAEPGLLDLIEYLAGWSTGAPLLIVCLARQELLERRASLATPKPNASSVLLDPLGHDDSARLIDNLLGGAGLTDQIRLRIVAAAEGNPLFVEEVLQMLIDDGSLRRRNGDWESAGDLAEIAIPPTIHALLAARLDRLEAGEQSIAERASVVGKQFWWGAVTELSPARERSAVGGHLQALVRKEFIRPDASSFAGEDAFQFGHILIRDAAYGALAKETRADLHERFVGWLEGKAARAHEYDEIVGYHLEAAWRYRLELAPADQRTLELGGRAGLYLGAAGKRALERGDVTAAVNLLDRTVALLDPDDALRVERLLDLAAARRACGDFAGASDALVAAKEAAAARADRRLEAHAHIAQLLLRADVDPSLGMDDVLRVSRLAFPIFEEVGDELGFAKAWRAIAEVHLTACRWGASAEALDRALGHAGAAGERTEVTIIENLLVNALFWGPMPAEEGARRCEAILAAEAGNRGIEANALCYLAGFRAMVGQFEEARDLYRRGRQAFADLGHSFGLAAHTLLSGTVELLAGDAEAAAREYRRGLERLEEMGETAVLSSSAAFLAEALYQLGSVEEAEAMTRLGERSAAEDDVAAQIGWRLTRAKVLAERGEAEAADDLSREAVRLADETDSLNIRADACLARAVVRRSAGDDRDARALRERAADLYAEKGNVVSARRARASEP